MGDLYLVTAEEIEGLEAVVNAANSQGEEVLNRTANIELTLSLEAKPASNYYHFILKDRKTIAHRKDLGSYEFKPYDDKNGISPEEAILTLEGQTVVARKAQLTELFETLRTYLCSQEKCDIKVSCDNLGMLSHKVLRFGSTSLESGSVEVQVKGIYHTDDSSFIFPYLNKI